MQLSCFAVDSVQAQMLDHLLVADLDCSQIQALVAGAQLPVLAGAHQGHPLAWISRGLQQQRKAGQPVRTLHLIAHGRPGAFRIGETWIDAEALKAHAADLAHWGVETIALWSCHVGADADVVALLAELSGAQVLASADWLGRDGDGTEQLQLGAWSLADLLEPKSWPAFFRLDVSIKKADGSGICAEDELLFKATADANGYVSVTFDLNDEQPLPAGHQLFFSATGQGDWTEYKNGYLAQLSGSAQGYFKVKLPDDTPIGTTLNAEIRQFEIDLGVDNPVIDVGKLQLNAHNAVVKDDNLPGPNQRWSNSLSDNKEYGLAYRYEDFLPQLSTLGYRLHADVGLKFNGKVKNYKFDDTSRFGDASDNSYLQRLQTRLDGTFASSVSYEMTFHLVDESGNRKQVDLENFWVNPVDIDSVAGNNNDSAEFFEIPDIGLAEKGSAGAASAGVIYELPTPLGGNGEKGPDSCEKRGNSCVGPKGEKNMIRLEKNNGQKLFRFHGARKWDAYDGDTWSQTAIRSRVPGASVLLDYRDPVRVLKFNLGASGNTGGNERFFSTALGNAFTVGVPEGNFDSDTASITLEDCFDFFITPTAACENEETESLTDASFTFEVVGGKENGTPQSLKGVYTYEISVDGERVGSEYAGYSYQFEDADGKPIDGISYDPTAYEQEGKGTLTVEGDIEDFRVVFDVGSLALGDQLAGDESVTLKLTHQETEKEHDATASLAEDLGCDPVESEDPSAFSITATAACENEETESLTDASFTFFVKGVNPGGNSLDSLRGTYKYEITAGGKRVGSEYAGYSYRIEDKRGIPLDAKKIVVDPRGQGKFGSVGTLDVNTDIEEFRVIFDVGALALGDQLVGDEEVRLELTRVDNNFSASDVARLDDDDLSCDPVESNPAFTITATAACENDATELLTDASFTFAVQGAVVPGSRERDILKGKYDYVLLVDGERVGSEYAGYSYRIEDMNGKSLSSKEVLVDEGDVGDGAGTLEIKKRISEFRVVFDVQTLVDGDQLSGDEEVTLTLARRGNYVNDYAHATASLADDDLECDPLQPDPYFTITPDAACENEETELLTDASFTFTVKGAQKADGSDPASLTGTYRYWLSAHGERVGSEYASYSYRVEDANGNRLSDEVVEVHPSGDGTGTLEVKTDLTAFRVVFDVESLADGDQLAGDEEVQLTLTRMETDVTDSALASLKNDDLECDPLEADPGFTIRAEAACENESTAPLTDATFSFEVQGALEPGQKDPDSLKGKYEYVLLARGEQVGREYAKYNYRIEDSKGRELNDDEVEFQGNGDGTGTLDVKSDLTDFRVVFDVETLVDGDQLSGDEEVQLTMTRAETDVTDSATASLADDDLDCDPLNPDQSEISITPDAACELDGTLSNKDAKFQFTVSDLPASDTAQTLDYVLTAKGLSGEGYRVNSTLLDSADDVRLLNGGERGSIRVAPGTESFSFTAKVTANDVLTGDESLRLRLKQDGELLDQATASLKDLDCKEPDPDTTPVALYLLMDNSTSMLQPDPSTEKASRSDRLEAQDRVALYAYQKAIAKAGYGFSRKGSGEVLSQSEFTDVVINNSASDLSTALEGFEVIADPGRSGGAQPVTVHLIKYGYAVDYGKVSFDAGDDKDAALTAAKTILDVSTPDQEYGNSIKGNDIWTTRNLPKPTDNDRFKGKGRPSSNLYSGTEMLGALTGLENLLRDQARSAGDEQPTTLISMFTDGRPERRAWWDTRKGPGSDSITGESIPLPDRLGGDGITTSGLIYDVDGNHKFLNDNDGSKPWRQMQRELNAVLDRIAGKSDHPGSAVQVEAMGMGDGTDANFRAIYTDLFGERTFDKNSAWTYEYNPSYALPEFGG